MNKKFLASFIVMALFSYAHSAAQMSPVEIKRQREAAAKAEIERAAIQRAANQRAAAERAATERAAKRAALEAARQETIQHVANLETSALAGDTLAAVELGEIYRFGTDEGAVKINYTEALKWFRRAKEEGSAAATRNLAGMYLFGEGVTTDAAQYQSLLLEAGSAGDAIAANILGQNFEEGVHGFEVDLFVAARWYDYAISLGASEIETDATRVREKIQVYVRRLADAAIAGNSSAAQEELAALYLSGKGVAKNPAYAVSLYQKAAEAGSQISQLALGDLYLAGKNVSRDYALARLWYQRASDSGSVEGTHKLGNVYANGLGVEKNIVEAVRLWSISAEKNYPNSIHNIAMRHFDGDGLPKDYTKGMEMVRQSASMGLVPSQIFLARALARGEIVATDRAKAEEYYRLAAAKNSAEAQYELALFLAEGGRDNTLPSEAMDLLNEASRNGFAEASFLLGWATENGVLPTSQSSKTYTVPKDVERAFQFYTAAIGQGDQFKAPNNLASMYSRGSGVKRDAHMAAKLYETAARAGNALAMLNLGKHYAMDVTLRDYRQAAYWLQMATQESGNQSAEFKKQIDELAPRIAVIETGTHQQKVAALNYFGDGQRLSSTLLEMAENALTNSNLERCCDAYGGGFIRPRASELTKAIAYLQLTMKVAMLENGKGGGRWEAVRNTHSKANSLFYQYKSYGNDWPNEIRPC